MILKINCIHNKNNAWCTNKNIKKSFWGLGARCCVEHQDKICELKQKKQRNEFKVKKKQLEKSFEALNELDKLKTEMTTLYMVLGAYSAYDTEEGFFNYVRSVLQSTEKKYIELSKQQ